MRRKNIVIIVISLVLLAVIAGILFCGTFEKDYGEYVLLRTPIGDLYFTEQWEKRVSTEAIPVDIGYAVDISAQISREKVSLYKLYIGAQTDEGIILGYVNDVEVRLDVQDAESGRQWKRADLDLLYTIQEDLGYIVDQIVDMEGFHAQIVGNTSKEEYFDTYVLLNTPIGEIYFTQQWANYVVVDEVDAITGYAVEISANTESGIAKLCALYVDTPDMGGTTIGYVNNMVVSYQELEGIVGDGWTNAAVNTVYSIQEALAGIVDQIVAMDGFRMEQNYSAGESTGEYVLLSTPVGDVRFTQKWKNWMTVEEYSTEEGYAATVSVQTDSGKVKVYDLFVGAETDIGVLIGYVNGIEIRFEMPDVELDSGWADADIDVVYSVQEELESLQDQFTGMVGFFAP